ncbi:uncharacterized protein LOC129732168 [Wyeomyia smithii]|uniref:uncharacterized protein LOC129732168 n=1 Tax=Wyeomyia smithii TaxID=174621 RepID=UPI0024680DB2|nr:uncharacterized protein LOC129732168 [Wyeomyia smithii]XP_055548719.1 uncharacterized protein LOC129732168 [Wyeomyia smithii]XP_055548720.1 uncharacterized protein LOC129732168 [Wyeomyia smithii]XP_055548721.1 uncharacterized protein LOC129732168 [Wyeomyia smithii]XP_055548722.1 uncharacterized protein LOC129732168 [Wyeomyia smithii]XP_055548723.1 uncharacterized protein LOC129732168 [Wyeomyia smithii]XP_055548725.1 uncharacterized protein LOC129732168 [Wyeomyia smithii]
MSVQRYKLIFILIFFIHRSNASDPPHGGVHSRPVSRSASSNLPPENNGRSMFSPRMEYNEWHPVGRGDPLKNDPTYDYSPPVLERVRYWPENMANKDKNSDILLLGVPSKKSSSKAVDQQLGWSNNIPLRRNYYHHQINQLPTVLMPPPLNNHLQQDSNDGHFWTQANTHQSQRLEAEGFRYKPVGPIAQSANSFVNQYSGTKYTEPSMMQMVPYQQQNSMQAHLNQPFTTTLRLTTPSDGSYRKPILHTILQNEKAYPFTKSTATKTITEYTSTFYNPQSINAMATTVIHEPQTIEYLTSETSHVIPTVSTEIRAPHVTPAAFVAPMTTTRIPLTAITSSSTTTTTTVAPPPAITADSLFSHYSQPAKQINRAPLYLIIEGHSKVKTYGLNNNNTLMLPPKMVPVVGSKDPVVRRVINRGESGAEMEVPHITMKPTTTTSSFSSDEESSAEKSAIDSLLGLLDSSFGGYLLRGDSAVNSIDSTEGDKDSKSRRNIRSIRREQQQRKEIYVKGSFVAGHSSGSSDGYHKGSVLHVKPTIVEGAY